MTIADSSEIFPSDKYFPDLEVFSSEAKKNAGILELVRSLGGRVLWLTSSDIGLRKASNLALEHSLPLSNLNTDPELGNVPEIKAATYDFVRAALAGRRKGVTVEPTDYSYLLFDNAEKVAPSVHRKLYMEFGAPATFAALWPLGEKTRSFLSSLDIEDDKPRGDIGLRYEPRRWGGQKFGDLWQTEAACGLRDTDMSEVAVQDVTEWMRDLCRSCPVKDDCLSSSLASIRNYDDKIGFTGGLTVTDRRLVRNLLDEGRDDEAAAMIEFMRNR